MGKKILIVDDVQEDLDLMKKILKKEGYLIKTVKNGTDALNSIETSHFDLILIDIMMPILSGYDLLQLLRKRLNHKVKMAYISVVPKKDVDTTDIDGFIQKPFSKKSLITEIKQILEKERKK